MDFCEKCRNLLEPTIVGNNVISRCHICKDTYPLVNPRIFSEDFENEEKKLTEMYIKAGLDDDTYATERIDCPKCDNKIMKYIKQEKDLRNIYICTKCTHYFTKIA